MPRKLFNPHRVFAILLMSAVAVAVLAQSVPAMQARHVCMQTLRVCELSHPGESVKAKDHDSCCKKKGHEQKHRQSDSEPGQAPPCSCCVTICSPAACAMVTDTAAWVEEPSLFDSIIAPGLPHACDWVGDLFRPPCL